jgi:hypothetical protein
MRPAKRAGPKGGKNMQKSAKKEWRRPSLRKLPIAATAGSKGHGGDEGVSTKTSGDAVTVS